MTAVYSHVALPFKDTVIVSASTGDVVLAISFANVICD
jgi:hypothetical protein